MKMMTIAALATTLLLPLSELAQAARSPSAPARNSQAARVVSHPLRGQSNPQGVGLAPTTWGFTSKYSGSLYGSGYYPFRVDLTYAGANSIYGYTFNYPSNGFVNDIRAVYLFDISGLVGEPSPLWSAFSFNLRERPAAGASGLFAQANVEMANVGSDFFLSGLALSQGGYSQNVDVYDAEDMENATPFANAQAAFNGPNTTLLTSYALPTNAVTPFNLDVTAAVRRDAPVAVAVPAPALGNLGIAAVALLLMGSGLLVMRTRN